MERALNLLLVEDDEGHALLIEDRLKQSLNIKKIFRVADGEEAIFFCRRSDPKPDLILLDIRLPKIDGYGVLQSLKNDKRFKSIPVIIVSSTADQGEVNYCYQLGVTGYIKKPISYEELGEKIFGLGKFLGIVALPDQ